MKKPSKEVLEKLRRPLEYDDEYHLPGLWAWSALIGTFAVTFLLWFFAIGTVLNIREWHGQLYDDFKEFQVLSNDAWSTLIGMGISERHSHITSTIQEIFGRKRPKRQYGNQPPQCRHCAAPPRNCEPGPPGPDGPPGTAGGYPGDDGRPGAPGLALILDREDPGCILCPAGPPGGHGPPDNLPGEKGPPGIKGADGVPGERGPQGKDGPRGEPGPPGPMGPMGEPGENGLDAEHGVGRPGPPGPKGRPGPMGERGLDGTSGQIGKPGMAGAVGTRGEPGRDGTDGPPGPPGLPGENGADGLYCECPPRENRPNALPASSSNYGGQSGEQVSRPSNSRPPNPFDSNSGVSRPASPSFNRGRGGSSSSSDSYSTGGAGDRRGSSSSSDSYSTGGAGSQSGYMMSRSGAGEYATISQQSELPVMHAPMRRKKKRPASDGQKIRHGAHEFNLASENGEHDRHLDLRDSLEEPKHTRRKQRFRPVRPQKTHIRFKDPEQVEGVVKSVEK